MAEDPDYSFVIKSIQSCGKWGAISMAVIQPDCTPAESRQAIAGYVQLVINHL